MAKKVKQITTELVQKAIHDAYQSGYQAGRIQGAKEMLRMMRNFVDDHKDRLDMARAYLDDNFV